MKLQVQNLKICILLFSVFVTSSLLAQDPFPGTALDFDGVDDYVEVAHSADLNPGQFTVSCWVKLNGVQNSYRSPLTSRGNFTGYMFYAENLNNWSFWVGDTVSWQIINGGSVLLNEWTHLCGTFDGNTLKFFINGELSGSLTSINFAQNNTYPLRIGAGITEGSPGFFFPGQIEEVSIWNTARTAQEIRENMHLTLSGNETSLVSYWQFNEATGDTTYDQVGGNHGTLFNMQPSDWITSTVPLGGGSSFTQIINTTGMFDFSGTGLSMDFSAKSGTDTVVVSRLDLAPNLAPPNHIVFDSQYWAINKFGSGTFNTDITFTVNEDITPDDQNHPENIGLFRRAGNADDDWYYLKGAVSVNAANNMALYNNISEFSQFIIGRGFKPIIESLFPADNATDVAVNTDLIITFNKNIYAGGGDISINHSADSTIFETIPAANTAINDSMVTINPVNNFDSLTTYYVLIDSTAFYDDSSFYYPGICDVESWNFTTISYFSEINAGLTGVSSSSVAWGDYDNDGDLDILITGYTPSGNSISRIYRNDSGVFTDINVGLTGVSRSSVAWGDYDNDGDLDILLTGSSISKIYRNDAGVFTYINAALTGVTVASVAWGDYDNDGDLDILLTGSSISKIYRNDAGVFTDINAGLTGVSSSSVARGDYDNDGDLDILLTGITFSGNIISRIYRNDAGVFTDINVGLTGVYSGSVAWGDYDNDGDLDILLTGNGISKIYRNDPSTGSGRVFTDINAGLPGIYNSSVAWGDYDNDGDLDILLTGNGISKIYRNDSGVFTDINVGLTGVNRSSVAWGDYDNDGDLDILLTGSAGSGNYVSRIYRNNCIIVNNAPLPPDGLTAVSYTDSLLFSWNKANDNETPQNGLSYNLVIGNSELDVFINSPMADINDGYRYIPAFGNTCQRNSWTLKVTYNYHAYPQVIAPDYWGVQTIDHAFAGSPFAKDSIGIPISFLPTINNNIMQLTDLLSWEIQFGDSVTSYQVQIDDDSTFNSYEVDDTLFVSISGTGYYAIPLQDLGGSSSLVAGTKYYWRMKPNYTFGLPTAFTKPVPHFHFMYISFVDEPPDDVVLKEFALNQNYPNPFNPITTIKFDLPKPEKVVLTIIDTQGKVVETLVNDYLNAGRYRYQWKPQGLASGLYFYSIKTASFKKVKKLMYIK